MRNKLFIIAVVLSTSLFFSCKTKSEDQNKNIAKIDSLSPEIAAISKEIILNPKNADLYFKRSKLYLNKQKTDEALADARIALSLDSTKSEFYMNISDIYFSMGKVKYCQFTLNKAMSLSPNSIEPILKVAELKFIIKDYKGSIEYLRKAIKIDKANPKIFYLTGMIDKEIGDTTKAIKEFLNAVELDNSYYDAYLQLGVLYSLKNKKIAVDYLNNALNIKPKSIEAYYALGMYYQEHEYYNEALAAYNSIIQIDPKFKHAYYNLGYVHLEYLRVNDVAAKYFSQAIQVDPYWAEAYYNRGYCFELMGDVNNARIDYTKALQLKTNYNKPIEGLNRIDRLMKK